MSQRRVLLIDRRIRVKSLEKYSDVVYTRSVDDAIENLKSQVFDEVWFTAKFKVPFKIVSALKMIADISSLVPKKCVVITSDKHIYQYVENQLSDYYKVERVFFRPEDIY